MSIIHRENRKTMKAFAIAIACLLLAIQPTWSVEINKIYLDVKPANTSMHLESIRMIPVSTFRLSYERSDSNRTRVGVVGAELAAVISDAVDIIPKRVLPSKEKGGKPIVLENFPSVNEQTLFMYTVGATQELAQMIIQLESRAEAQMKEIADVFGEVAQLEKIISASSEGDAELRMREAAAKVEIVRNEMEMEIMRAKDEEEYSGAMRKLEDEQLQRNEALTFERVQRENAAAKKRTQQLMRAKFEASHRIERTRAEAAEEMATIEHEQKILLQKAAEEMKIHTAKVVAIAKAEAERANEDVHLRRLQAEHEQRRKRNVAAINTVFAHMASSLSLAAKNPKQVFTLIGYACLLAAAIFSAKEASRLIRSMIEATIGKPQLIRETSRKNIVWYLLARTARFVSQLSPWKCKVRSDSVDESFSDLILPKELKARVLDLAQSARNARSHNAPFRHVLLYGPPGTGKTLVAKKLAKVIGTDYAMMSGGDVSPLGPDAVTQIHQLFSWASMSPKGVVLFIDEAECFLGARDSGLMSDTSHNALNALLYNTGGERKDFMLVLATNRAEDLDAAVLDRCDESLFFPLPNAECRKDLILLYFDLHFRKFMEANNKHEFSLRSRLTQNITKQKPNLMSIESDLMTGQQLQSTVAVTHGFSGREIGKLMIALQGAMYVAKDHKLDFEAAWKLIKTKVKEHHEKIDMVRKRVDCARDSTDDEQVDQSTRSSPRCSYGSPAE